MHRNIIPRGSCSNFKGPSWRYQGIQKGLGEGGGGPKPSVSDWVKFKFKFKNMLRENAGSPVFIFLFYICGESSHGRSLEILFIPQKKKFGTMTGSHSVLPKRLLLVLRGGEGVLRAKKKKKKKSDIS